MYVLCMWARSQGFRSRCGPKSGVRAKPERPIDVCRKPSLSARASLRCPTSIRSGASASYMFSYILRTSSGLSLHISSNGLAFKNKSDGKYPSEGNIKYTLLTGEQTDGQTDVDRKTVRMLRSRTVKCSGRLGGPQSSVQLDCCTD